MNSTPAALAMLIGLAARLAVPILITTVVVFALGRLDRHWQAEAKNVPLQVEKPKCWKIQRCSPALQKACSGFASPLPCWQVFRQPSGYLDEKCLGCPVLLQAPLPAHA
jgi:hypothetical protein